MEREGVRLGHLAALVGAAVTLIGLWQPWYEVQFPEAARTALSAQAAQLPPGWSSLAQGLAAVLPESITANGWQALHGADVAFTLGAIAVALLALAAAGVFGAVVRIEPAAAGRWIIMLGLAGVGLGLYHWLHHPLAETDLLSVRVGVWLAVGGSAIAVLGGAAVVTAGPRHVAEPPPAPVVTVMPAFEGAKASVPPPGA